MISGVGNFFLSIETNILSVSSDFLRSHLILMVKSENLDVLGFTSRKKMCWVVPLVRIRPFASITRINSVYFHNAELAVVIGFEVLARSWVSRTALHLFFQWTITVDIQQMACPDYTSIHDMQFLQSPR